MFNKIRLDKLAQKIGAKLYGDSSIIITGVASINTAKSGDVTFLKDYRLRKQLCFCKASAVILSEENLSFCCATVAALVVKDPYLSYIKIVQLLLATTPKLSSTTIALGSIIDPNAIVGSRVGIGSNVIVESGVILNDDVQIGSGSFIGKNTTIGTGTYLYPNVIIYHETEIGECCMIQSGAVIGSDGFGYVKNNNAWIKVPQLGKVKIGSHVEIGAGTTIDRGTLDDTQIKDGVIIDNQCQVAHNVVIGECTAIAGGVVMAGSLVIGKHCMIGGASVINGHISICDRVIITGMSMVIKSIKKPGVYSSGMPLLSNIEWRKTVVLLRNIKSITKHIKIIDNHVKNLYCYYVKVIRMMYFFILLGLIGFGLLIRCFFNQE